jgi:hypothetical protein
MRRLVLFAAAYVMFMYADPASAMSCTDQESKCLQLAIKPEIKAACRTENRRCFVRCKRREMWFVGPVTGTKYPVSSCQ